MSDTTRVLFVTQAMQPYLPETRITKICRELPQSVQEKGREIRNFMPRYGNINERRHQLHEVIRLSGMNLVVDDHDHPLIIKVASIQPAKMQVYFIDNEEYFKRKSALTDIEGNAHPDNDERMIFFCKGVIETVKKLGWAPDIIHCHGWMSSLLPLFIKKVYNNEPMFANSKVVFSVYADEITEPVNNKLFDKLKLENIDVADYEAIKDPSYDALNMFGASCADAVIIADENASSKVVDYVKTLEKPVLDGTMDDYFDEYDAFYDKVKNLENALAD
jgi:starch synthase